MMMMITMTTWWSSIQDIQIEEGRYKLQPGNPLIYHKFSQSFIIQFNVHICILWVTRKKTSEVWPCPQQ